MRIVRAASQILCAMLLLVSCADSSEKMELSTYFFNAESRRDFVELLKTEGIPHHVDHDGTVWYRTVDSDKVANLQAKIINSIGQYAASYRRSDEEDMFTEALAREGIRYEIKIEGDRRWVLWQASDDKKVTQIKEEVKAKILQKRAEERQNRAVK